MARLGRGAPRRFRPAPVVSAATSDPGTVLDIGSARSTHFLLQYAQTGAGSTDTATQADILGGFSIDPYFKTTADNLRVQLWARLDAPLLGSSTFSRAELREVNADGSDAAWDPYVGAHIFDEVITVTNLPTVTPAAVFFQMFDNVATADRISYRTQLVSGTARLRLRINGSTATLDAGGTDLAVGVGSIVGVANRLRVVIVAGAISIYFNDMVTPVLTRPAGTLATNGASCYFKTGIYNQANTGTGDSGSDFGAVEITRPTVVHVGAAAALGGLTAAATGTAWRTIESLTDNFDDNTIDTAKWPASFGTPTESGGQARVPAAANAGISSGYGSAARYSLVGSSVLALATPPSLDASTFAASSLTLYGDAPTYTTLVRVMLKRVAGGLVVGGQIVIANSTTYNATDVPITDTGSAWIRLRESGGTLFGDYSDGISWTNAWSTTAPSQFLVKTLELDLEAYRSATTGDGTAGRFDNLNLLVSAVTGTATAALGALSAAATGVRKVPGTASSALGALSSTATGTRKTAAAAAASLGALTSSATGTRKTSATAAAPLGGLSAAAAGTRKVAATAAAPLGGITGSAAGTRKVTAAAAATLGGLTSSATGTRKATGTAAAPLGALTATTSGTRSTTAAASAALGALTATAVGARKVVASAAASLGALVGTAAGHRLRTGTASAPLGGLTSAAVGTRKGIATAAAPLGALAAAGTGLRSTAGVAAASLGALVGEAVGGSAGVGEGSAHAGLGPLAATATGTRTVRSTATATLGGLSSAATGTTIRSGVAAANLGGLAATSAGVTTRVGTATAPLGSLSAHAEGTATGDGAGNAAAALGPLTSTAVGTRTTSSSAAAPLGGLSATAASVRYTTGSAAAALGALTGSASGTVVAVVTGTASANLGALISEALQGDATIPGSGPLHAGEVTDTPGLHGSGVRELVGVTAGTVVDSPGLHARL